MEQSGGDALNFNSGEYIISGNIIQDTGDGCIALNNDAFGVVSNEMPPIPPVFYVQKITSRPAALLSYERSRLGNGLF